MQNPTFLRNPSISLRIKLRPDKPVGAEPPEKSDKRHSDDLGQPGKRINIQRGELLLVECVPGDPPHPLGGLRKNLRLHFVGRKEGWQQ